jgi:hypothetical protein
MLEVHNKRLRRKIAKHKGNVSARGGLSELSMRLELTANQLNGGDMLSTNEDLL